MDLGRAITLLGLSIVVVGLLISFGPSLPGLRWLGHLPGDLQLQRGNLRLFLPITSSVLVSVVLTLLLHGLGLLLRR